MADVILTLSQLGDLFYDLSVSMIGGSPDIRQSWPTGGAPAFKVTDNVAFLKVYDVGSAISTQQELEYSYVASPELYNEKTSYTRTLMVNWIFYGSNSWDNAAEVRNGLFRQENRNTLAVQNIYLVPDGKTPQRTPELWMGQWYERVDLNMTFNELISVNSDSNFIEEVLVGLYDRNGLQVSVTVK